MEPGAIHREKIVWRWGAALFAASALFAAGVGAAIFAVDPTPMALLPLVPATALGGAAVLFSVLRVSVSRERVHVQLGPAGPAIPTAAIESVEVRRYPWERYGGWGVRLGIDGSWAYSIPGVSRGVRIAWRDAGGARRVAFVSSRDPEALAEAIAGTRSAAPYREVGPAVRVAAEDADAIPDADEVADEPVEPGRTSGRRA